MLERIKQAVAASGIPHWFIAAHCGTTPSAFSRIIHGTRRITTTELALLCELLEIDPAILLIGRPWTEQEIEATRHG